MWGKIALVATIAAYMAEEADARHYYNYGYSRRYGGYGGWATWTYGYAFSNPASTTDTLFGGTYLKQSTSYWSTSPIYLKTQWSGLTSGTTYAIGLETSTTTNSVTTTTYT